MLFLVDRGNCSFATKAYYSELAGASLLIVVDREGDDLNNKTWITDDSSNVGAEVGIPAMMIKYETG